jgi:hypothetical protein
VAAQFDVRPADHGVACCSDAPRVAWYGTEATLSLSELAAACGPVLWFSPDEPLLDGKTRPEAIDIPTAFPFEGPTDRPVVYYRLRTILTDGGGEPLDRSLSRDPEALLHLEHVTAIDLDYFFYYPSEEGLGGHLHDVESVEMKLAVLRIEGCENCSWAIFVQRINAKAHGVLWYDNTLDTDPYTELPIHILVEEGKHASCTDKNGDGYFTPGYDVNRRINDAWGVRDVIRSGGLYTGGFQSWMAKVRRPQDRVFPPLPAGSPARQRVQREQEESLGPEAGYRTYEVRPFPPSSAAAEDPVLVPFLADKGREDWPEIVEETDLVKIGRWAEEESFVKSIGVSLRVDEDLGFSTVFPLFIIRNFNEPLAGGWLVNRIYLKDQKLRDFGWNVLYTPSASRWIDSYFSVGLEVDEDDAGDSRTWFATEAGFKLRADLRHSPLKFITGITDFWGVRVGLRYRSYNPVRELGYVIEFGAGAF